MIELGVRDVTLPRYAVEGGPPGCAVASYAAQVEDARRRRRIAPNVAVVPNVYGVVFFQYPALPQRRAAAFASAKGRFSVQVGPRPWYLDVRHRTHNRVYLRFANRPFLAHERQQTRFRWHETGDATLCHGIKHPSPVYAIGMFVDGFPGGWHFFAAFNDDAVPTRAWGYFDPPF